MEYTYPDYYKEFSCIAGKCEDTCCAGWGIYIDDKSMEKYKKYKGKLKNRLHNCIDKKEKSFEQIEGRCAFLNEENLCDLYAEAGPKMLCKTCRRYPRHMEEFENLREISLSLSCPEAARMIVNNTRKVVYKTKERESREEEYEEFDLFLFTKLLEIRDFLITTLQRRELSLELRMSLILACCHDLQNRIDERKLFAIDDLLCRYETERFLKKAETKFEEYEGSTYEAMETLHKIFRNMYRMEVLNDLWPSYLKECEKTVFALSEQEYVERKEEFHRAYPEYELQYEQILIYYIFGYFTGAIYDKRAYDKVRFAVVNVLLLHTLALADFINKGEFTKERQIEIVHRYARELEHSDPNLDELEVLIGYEEEYKLEPLLCCIWT